MTILKLTGLCLLSIMLTGCFNNDDDDDGNVGSVGGVDGTSLTAIGGVAADGEPVEILDPGALSEGISALFGNADDNPLDVEMGDTIQMIVDRNVRIES